MAFSVKQIKAILSKFNIPVENLDDAADEIAARHSADLDSIKEERDSLRKDAETLASVKKQLDDANEKLKAAAKEDYKGKYESEKAAHDKLKAETAAEKTRITKETAMREALKAAGYSDKGIAKIIKFGGLSEKITLDDDGKATNTDEFVKAADSEWSEYKGESKPASAAPATPPDDTGSKADDPQLAHAAALAAKFHADRYGANPKPEKEG